ncbi:hypothetical protein [Pseudoalteromonas ardens]|uniref:Uncharacterized protein n=1 Tax=Pseudoalteromonas rubra TaxID=43658 RepID=A0A0L0EVI6_9GAMM|nr:hypothetical protein [Pseudoalteromonas sp. R96]KNC68424.1 hypothetical protein AC626_04725 [Pseudoalteromonas rubra]MDK1312082.1 hypothetical protein [Pseudoalteromonas sp. R96]
MAYELMIWKDEGITLEDWLEAVDKCELTKPDTAGIELRNPSNGEKVSIQGAHGDVAVKFTEKGFLGLLNKTSWHTSFFFRHSYGAFVYTDSLELPENPVRIAAVKLAKLLDAKIIGEEDEEYHW